MIKWFGKPYFLLTITIVEAYTLLKRNDHTANYIDDKIYFLGGEAETVDDKKLFTDDFFYLDVSKPFTLNESNNLVTLTALTDLTRNSYKAPSHARATSITCNSNNYTYLLGGELDNHFLYYNSFGYKLNYTPPIFHKFNKLNDLWKRIRWPAGICDGNKMYIFGGSYYDSNGQRFSDDLKILDINQLTSTEGSKFAPAMDGATATLLPDGRIVYLGGNIAMPPKYINMSEIYLYDTSKDEWSMMKTTGNPPAARGLHTAVLMQDGRIVVYGGENPQFSPAPDQLSVLNTKLKPFRWSIPVIDDTPNFAPFRGHTATLVGNYTIISFGMFYIDKNNPLVRSDKIFILYVNDKNNYKWVKEFIPPPNITVLPLDPASTHTPEIFGFVSKVILTVIVIMVSFYYFLQHFKDEIDSARTPIAGGN